MAAVGRCTVAVYTDLQLVVTWFVLNFVTWLPKWVWRQTQAGPIVADRWRIASIGDSAPVRANARTTAIHAGVGEFVVTGLATGAAMFGVRR